MSADISQKEVHWQRTKSLMIVHLVIWFIFSFVVHWFAASGPLFEIYRRSSTILLLSSSLLTDSCYWPRPGQDGAPACSRPLQSSAAVCVACSNPFQEKSRFINLAQDQ